MDVFFNCGTSVVAISEAISSSVWKKGLIPLVNICWMRISLIYKTPISLSRSTLLLLVSYLLDLKSCFIRYSDL